MNLMHSIIITCSQSALQQPSRKKLSRYLLSFPCLNTNGHNRDLTLNTSAEVRTALQKTLVSKNGDIRHPDGPTDRQ